MHTLLLCVKKAVSLRNSLIPLDTVTFKGSIVTKMVDLPLSENENKDDNDFESCDPLRSVYLETACHLLKELTESIT